MNDIDFTHYESAPDGATRRARLLAVERSPLDGWRAICTVSLPDSAGFFFRNRESLIPSDYGPEIRPHISCFDGDLCSQGLVILGDAARGCYVLIGALAATKSLTYLSVHVRQKRFDRLTISQPDVLGDAAAEPLIAIEGDDWRTLLTTYAERVRAHAGMKPLPVIDAPARGYCTWYYSYQNVTEVEFKSNLAMLENHRDRFAAYHAQIDDGYQNHHGDWLETNTNWPSSLEQVAADIAAKGFVPGIWTMPLLASTGSRLFREHAEWFIGGPDGSPLIIPGWSPPPEDRWVCLDASRPEVRQHLHRVFSTLRRWGYRYFKLDGLGMSYPAGHRFDKAATGISCLRDCLKIIREAAGADSVVMSCGGPFLAAVGLADQARVSGDTGKFWKADGVPGLAGLRGMEDWETQDPAMPSLSNAIEQSLNAWWRYDRWFRADPDVAMLRDENIHLTVGEARMSALVAMMAGVVFTSDRLDRMAPDRLDLLSRIWPRPRPVGISS